MNSKLQDNSIVISGMSGRFSNSRTIADFKRNLFNKVDMIEPCKKELKLLNDEFPDRCGRTLDADKFDSEFFGVPVEFQNSMDPQCRMILEHVYEALLDAGIPPSKLRGTNTGIFVGCFFADAFETCIRDGDDWTGSLRAFMANFVSFAFDFKGPSFVVDTACSSSGYAADLAFKSLQSGECDQAILVGSNLILGKALTLGLIRWGVLAKDGYAQTFDENAHGYCRGDAVVAMLLQRSQDAKRNYATILNTKKNVDGYKKEGFAFPSRVMQTKLFEEFYTEIGLDPNLVDYMEAHSTGTKVGDPEECAGIDKVLCSNRTKPLLIGSVKSNMGHGEAAAMSASMVKSILSFENKKLPPNLHLNKLRTGIPALDEGRIKVVDEVQDFEGSLIAINSFGAGGANSHVLLKANEKEKVNDGIPIDDLPRMALWSGRTEEAVNNIFDHLANTSLDIEQIALLQNSQVETPKLNTYRGFGIFRHNKEIQATECISRSVFNNLEAERPVVWVYSGMGSQWPQMLSDLQKIPIFNTSIDKCHEILLKKGINLIETLSSPNELAMENVVHAYVGIAAIQIGLTDILRALDIKPDFIIGHSVGEFGCAYGDECNSAEEVILSAYSRGMAIQESEIANGAMVAVGMGHEKLKEILIDGIEIACHNSADSSTISGPFEVVRKFTEKLKELKIFFKEVNSSNIPFHSSYISNIGPKLLARLKEVIKKPKERSSRWLSTSVGKDLWENDDKKLSSAEYHTNNLLNPVLFQEALEMLPENALTIEIGPSGLLQAILRRAMPNSIHFSLTKKNDDENSVHLITALGKIFQNGVDMEISKLYPPVEYPVSRGTPMISPLIKWNHSHTSSQFRIEDVEINEMKVVVNLGNPKFKFLAGHKIEGKIVFPATGYLYYATCLAAAHHKKSFEDSEMELEDLKFLNVCFLVPEKETTLKFIYHGGDGKFEVCEGKTLMCTGFVRPTTAKLTPFKKPDNALVPVMSGDDIYKDLRVCGYHYEDLFRSITSAKIDGSQISVKWSNNWIAFLDHFAQMVAVREDIRAPIVPTKCRRAIFKPQIFMKALEKTQNTEQHIDGYYVKHLNLIACEGIEFRGFEFANIPKQPQPGNLVLQSHEFVPHFPTPVMSKIDAATFCVHLTIENFRMLNLKVAEVDSSSKKDLLCQHFVKVFENSPISSDVVYLTDEEMEEVPEGVKVNELKAFNEAEQFDIIIKANSMNDEQFLKNVEKKLYNGGLLVSREPKDVEISNEISENFKLAAKIQLESENLFVFKFSKNPIDIPSKSIKVSSIGSDKYAWIEEVKEAIKTDPIILYAEDESESGIAGLFNCMRREPNGNNVRCIFIDDPKAPKFSPRNEFYRKQLERGLVMNVYRNGHWGTFRHFDLKPTLIRNITLETMAVANASVHGNFSSLNWFESPFRFNHTDEIITVHYAALNFRDIMIASNRIPLSILSDKRTEQSKTFGYEFSGVTSKGRRVMGLVPMAGMATHIKYSDILLFDVPKDWSLEEGATVLGTYFTVFLGLFYHSKIKTGNSILIHAGCGGVGLSAIHVAASMDLEIFTTVSTDEKRNYLLETFPKLKAENIGNSRDTSFEDMIMVNTNGKGVDFVLNSLADDKLLASLRCLGEDGTFVEIGKSDIFRDNKINLGCFAKNIKFFSMNASLAEVRGEEMTSLLNKGIEDGIVKPLKSTVFNADQLEEAFRFMASGKHIGKVLLKIRDENGPLMTEIIPRVAFNPQHSYIICGGLGGFGMELADWMIIRGCRKIVLSSSRGIIDGYQKYRFRYWSSYGVEIKVSTADITIESGCHQLIAEAADFGPVGGIFNLAARLTDALFENQTIESFEQANAFKGIATKLLDDISRKSCKNLQHFVVFSSTTCGYGNAGQTNYGMANSVMERIMENRKNENLPGKAIQWGAIGDVGMFTKYLPQQKLNSDFQLHGTWLQSIHSCLEVLDTLMTSSEPIVTSFVVADKATSTGGLMGMLERLMKILGIKDINAYPKNTRFVDFGIDSLITVEVIQYAERELNTHITVDDLRSMTLFELIEIGKNGGKTAANDGSDKI